MKKLKIGVVALMLSGMSYAQSIDYINSNKDTLAHGIAGKTHFEFDYYTSKIIKTKKYKIFENITINIKKNELLYIDLYDDCKCNSFQDIEKLRNVTVYLRDGNSYIFEYESGNKTLTFPGNIVEKVKIHKPKVK